MNDKLLAIADCNANLIEHLGAILEGMKDLNAILEEGLDE